MSDGTEESVTSRDVVVHGRVQGVFFRDSTQQEARRLGVGGWVRNEPDGTVRVHVEGPAEAVDALVAWLHEGPPFAQVERVQVDAAADPPRGTGASGFEVR